MNRVSLALLVTLSACAPDIPLDKVISVDWQTPARTVLGVYGADDIELALPSELYILGPAAIDCVGYDQDGGWYSGGMMYHGACRGGYWDEFSGWIFVVTDNPERPWYETGLAHELGHKFFNVKTHPQQIFGKQDRVPGGYVGQALYALGRIDQ